MSKGRELPEQLEDGDGLGDVVEDSSACQHGEYRIDCWERPSDDGRSAEDDGGGLLDGGGGITWHLPGLLIVTRWS